jgi:NADH-quinone oxidoreductase subunit L
MTAPLIVLAVGALLLGFLGTPVWPWFHDYFNGRHSGVDFSRLREAWPVMAIATLLVVAGLGLGWRFYGGKRIVRAEQADALEAFLPGVFEVLRRKFLVDELYEATVIRWNAHAAAAMNWLDHHVWETGVLAIGYLTLGLSWASRLFDDYVVNLGFDTGCDRVRKSAKLLSRVQNGQVQSYLRIVAVALALLVLLLAWGGGL